MNEKTESKAEIAPELTQKVQALRALVTTYNLFNEGSFPLRCMQAALSAQNFLQSLHGSLVEEALAHPDADKVPEIKEMKDQKAARLAELRKLEKEMGEDSVKN